MKRRCAWAAVLAVSPFLCACDLFEKVTADKMLVVTWIAVPSITTPPFNQVPGSGATTVTAIFATRSGATPEPISGAYMAFFGIGKLVALNQAAPGTYTQTSVSNPTLAYDDDAQHRYGFEACSKNTSAGCIGSEYTIKEILAAPAVAKTTLTLSPALSAAVLPGTDGALPVNTALTVTFPPPPAGDEYRPFLTVFGQQSDGSVGQVFSNLPSQPLEWLNFLNTLPPSSITIPASAFPSPGVFVVMAAAARLSLATSPNLFLGSGALAGSANVFLIEAQ